MAESLKVLRRRVRSVKSIKQITRAMEMVAAAKLRRAQGVLGAARPYASKLRELLAHLAEGSDLKAHPLFQPREGNRKLLIVFTADRGLCGSFNTNLIKQAERLLKANPDVEWQLYCVGRKGFDYFNRRQWPIAGKVIGLGGQADLDAAREVSRFAIERFESGTVSEVLMTYSEFVSTVVNRPVTGKYLPLDAEALGKMPEDEQAAGGRLEYLLEPSADRVIDLILPRYLTSSIYITMAEVATSEHSSRMIAMSNASKNCQELGDQLTLRMNNARQAAITKELLEIVSGAEALKAS